MELAELPRQLEAIRHAAETLGLKVREVEYRLASIATAARQEGATPAIVRRHVINIRGYDMPPQFGTSLFLDLQLERLIDMLASPEERAELDAIAAKADDEQEDWFDVQSQAGRGVTW